MTGPLSGGSDYLTNGESIPKHYIAVARDQTLGTLKQTQGVRNFHDDDMIAGLDANLADEAFDICTRSRRAR